MRRRGNGLWPLRPICRRRRLGLAQSVSACRSRWPTCALRARPSLTRQHGLPRCARGPSGSSDARRRALLRSGRGRCLSWGRLPYA
eukprot:15476795-Alexandrium_andersonii.AAC.1